MSNETKLESRARALRADVEWIDDRTPSGKRHLGVRVRMEKDDRRGLPERTFEHVFLADYQGSPRLKDRRHAAGQVLRQIDAFREAHGLVRKPKPTE